MRETWSYLMLWSGAPWWVCLTSVKQKSAVVVEHGETKALRWLSCFFGPRKSRDADGPGAHVF